MSVRSKTIITLVLLLALTGLALANTFLTDNVLMTQHTPTLTQSGGVIPGAEAGGVAKYEGPNIAETLKNLSFTMQDTTEQSMIAQIVTGEVPVTGKTLLVNGDRAGAVLWIETGEVKTYFKELKDALLAAFSQNVTDLRDTVEQGNDAPIRNILTFLDPNLSEERLTFVRVRQRLYEFHTAKGKESMMQPVIEQLTTM